jgi:peptide/nickel transport system substrate-binding protein
MSYIGLASGAGERARAERGRTVDWWSGLLAPARATTTFLRAHPRPRPLVLGVTVLLALPLVATSAAAGSAATAGGKPVLTIGLTAGPVSLDPAKDQATFRTARSLTNEAILHMRPDGTVGPALATKWRYLGAGNKNFEFTLRQNARFSNGERVTAQAVKTWLEYFGKGTSPFLSIMGPVRSIETVGRWTVRLHLRSPNPMIPAVLSELYNWGSVSAPASVANPSALATRTFGAGPYVLAPSQTVSGSTYTFAPNPYYYDKARIRWSKVVVRVIPSASSILQAILAGQIDVVAGGDVSTADAARSAGLTVVSVPVGWGGLLFPDLNGTVAKPLADVRVRQALNYAVDRRAIAAGLVGKWGRPTSEMLSTDGWDPKYQNKYPYNPSRARSLLAAAGYRNGFTLEVLTGAFFPSVSGEALDQAIGKYLEAVGVTLKITSAVTPGEFVQKQRSATFPVMQNTAGTGPMWLQYGFRWHPKGVLNPFGISDDEMTKLWLKGQRATKPEQYWQQMSRRATDQAYALPIYTFSGFAYATKRVGNVFIGQNRSALFATEWFPK